MVAAASNIVSNGIVLEVLTRDNYLNWSTLVKNYLVGKDLWDNIVEDINSDEIVPDWKSKNSKALHAIQLSCGYQTLSQIRNSETAKEAWNHLKASFSEDVEAYHDIEQGRSESDNHLDQFHSSVKKGLWNEAESILNRDRDIISRRSSSTGWTALHVAVVAGQEKIMDELFKRKGGKLLKKTDWRGYTALALAAEVTDNKKIAEWMIDNGGSDLLTMKTKADNGGKGEIPVVLASAKGNKEMTRYLFSETPWFSLQDDNCYYGAMLLSRCIYAEILVKSYLHS
ncbi:Ankyrin repeat [Sesbania bispinosa]|nr:Ankyrin repeat [Sesbania bispinosa]